jgi:hypothetical protein
MVIQKGGKLQCWTRKNKRLENYVVCTGKKTNKTRKKQKSKKVTRKRDRRESIVRGETKVREESKIHEEKTPDVTQKDILKMVKNYPELGITSSDWMTDPCHVLLNMKRKLKIKKWSDSLLRKLNKTIPLIERTSQMIRYGNYKIRYLDIIGSGSYGTVYSATMTDIKTNRKKNIVIKDVQTTDPLEFFSESILQLVLFCGMRGKFGFGARIPKLEFVSKYKSRTTGKMKYVVGMEPLDGDGWKFFASNRIKSIEKIKGIRSIAKLLEDLQKKFKFMHRDLHLGNIMYKNLAPPGQPVRYKFYIIDFGFSTAVFNGFRINETTNMYRRFYFLNKSHDLRMLVTSIFRSKNAMSSYKINLRFAIINFLYLLTTYYQVDQSPFFWDTYSQVVKFYDPSFDPANVINMCDFLIKRGSEVLQKNKMSSRQYQDLYFKFDEVTDKPVLKWENDGLVEIRQKNYSSRLQEDSRKINREMQSYVVG